MQFVVEDAPDLTIPADTVVRGRLEEIKLHEFDYTNKEGNPDHGAVLQWWFEVTDTRAGDGKWLTRKVKGETDTKISNHPRNRFRQWAEVLLGRDLAEGQGIDTDDLIGLSCDLQIDHQADKKDPAKTYERVSSLLPLSSNDTEIPF